MAHGMLASYMLARLKGQLFAGRAGSLMRPTLASQLDFHPIVVLFALWLCVLHVYRQAPCAVLLPQGSNTRLHKGGA